MNEALAVQELRFAVQGDAADCSRLQRPPSPKLSAESCGRLTSCHVHHRVFPRQPCATLISPHSDRPSPGRSQLRLRPAPWPPPHGWSHAAALQGEAAAQHRQLCHLRINLSACTNGCSWLHHKALRSTGSAAAQRRPQLAHLLQRSGRLRGAPPPAACRWRAPPLPCRDLGCRSGPQHTLRGRRPPGCFRPRAPPSAWSAPRRCRLLRPLRGGRASGRAARQPWTSSLAAAERLDS